MTDCQKSTPRPATPLDPSRPARPPAVPPPHSEDWLVFRESFLAYFEPEARATLRAAGDILYTRIISGDMPRERESWTHTRLRALVRDLQFAAQLLTEIADEPNQSEFNDPDELRLQQECPLWAQAATEIVLAIEAAVGAPPASSCT